MTFGLEPGFAEVTNTLGRRVFHSGDRLLHADRSGLPITGSVAIGNLTAGNGVRIDQTDVWDLGAATLGHTQVIGVAKFDLANSNAPALAFDRYHLVMGGTIVWNNDGEPGFVAALGDNGGSRQWIDYHFRILAGRVELVRRAFLDDTALNYTVLAHTITYQLRSGNWT